MRICFLAHLSSVRTRRLARAFAELGHTISILSLTPGEPVANINSRVLLSRPPGRYERSNWPYLLALPRLRRAVAAFDPDLVYAQFVSSNGVLAALAVPRRYPVALAAQGDDVLTIARRSPLHRWAARLALRRARLVLTPAEHLSDAVRRLHPSANILTRQYGVDVALFRPPPDDAARAPLVLSGRALMPRMGVETVLAAARHLYDLGSPLDFEVAHNGELRAQLTRETADLVAAGRVRFVGMLDDAELAHRLQHAALYVSMAESDGTSITLLEAMASGCFPVVSDIPANRPWITHGETGLLVAPGDAVALAEALTAAWADPDLRHRAARRNRARVAADMDRRRNMAEIAAALRAVAAGEHAAR